MSLHVCISNFVKESNFYTAVRFYRKGHCVVGEWSFYVYEFRLCLKFVYLSVYMCAWWYSCVQYALHCHMFFGVGCVNLKRRKSGSTKRTFPFLARILSMIWKYCGKKLVTISMEFISRKAPVYKCSHFMRYTSTYHIIMWRNNTMKIDNNI